MASSTHNPILPTTSILQSVRQIPLYWRIAWAIIYALIILTDLFVPSDVVITTIKLSSIFLCLVYCVITFPRDHFLQLAMLITFIADCFLASNNTSSLGLLIFFIAQSIHLLRLQPPEKRQTIIIIVTGALFVITLNLFLKFAPDIFLICGFYGITLALNVFTSWQWFRTAPPNTLPAYAAFYGFILFACCDICTVLSYLSLTALIPTFLYAPANFFAWFFYYPSQILVSNSSKCATIKTKEGKC